MARPSSPQPLASAAKRLSESPPSGFPRRPGRPKKAGTEAVKSGQGGGSLTTVAPIAPRLLSLKGAAVYLGGLSVWTVRDLLAAGHLRRVRLPLRNGAELNRVLIAVEDLDALVAQSKESVL